MKNANVWRIVILSVIALICTGCKPEYTEHEHQWVEVTISPTSSLSLTSSITAIGKCPCGRTETADLWDELWNSITAINVDAANTVFSSENGVLYDKNKTTLIRYPPGKKGAFTIPDSVTNIGWLGGAFNNCTKLTAINVDAGNSTYSSQDGVLYDKAKTKIIQIPEGITGNVTIPNSVTSIGGWAFVGCTKLTSITIGNGVTSIEEGTFLGCTGLISVTIPASVTSIGNIAFLDCISLTSVTFATGSNIASENFGSAFPVGSERGWIGDNLNNAYLAANPKAGTYTRPKGSWEWTKR